MGEDSIPKEIVIEDPEGDDGHEKSKGFGGFISKVKSNFGKKKTNAATPENPAVRENETPAVKESETLTDATDTPRDTANKKTPKKKKTKKKSKKKEKAAKNDGGDDDDGVEDEYSLPDSDESEGEISIPFEIEVLAVGNDDDHARADEERESKKHESMHNSHNALKVLERADSGKSMGKSRRISNAAPKRNRSINAQEALERVNSSKPLSDIQRELKTRERTRVQGRKRPSVTGASNPQRTSSLKTKGSPAGVVRPHRTSSMNAAHALANEDNEALQELYKEAQLQADQERRRRNGDDNSSRRTQRSNDEDFGSRRTARSTDEDFHSTEFVASSSRRTNRSTDEEYLSVEYTSQEDFIGSSRRTQGSVDEDLEGSKQSHTGRSMDISSRRTQRSIDVDWDDEDEKGLEKRAAERRARRESTKDASSQAAEVLQRADSGKSLKEIANDSRRRRGNSAGPQGHRRNNSAGPRSRRVSAATPEGGAAAAADYLRMAEIEAAIKAEEQALKESS